ncbi:hypothetical protein RIF29_00558 [Crotalaria pallida]|uniref:Uncharacterized protein n=1 Tax=Crotalaria pallida TaxID=3830 RepID=A0AAN9IWM1_CROPI
MRLDPTEDLRNSFKFKHYVILSKIYKHKNVEQKRKVSNDSDEAIIYIKPEGEIFQKLSSWSFIFPLRTQQPAPHEVSITCHECGNSNQGLPRACERVS